MYSRCDIDKARGRGETWPVDPELRDALNQMVVDLRGETRDALDRFAADLRGEIQTSAASLLQQMREMESGMRRHFDVVGESLRSDIRAVSEGMAASREQTERRLGEQAGRTDGLEARVLRLEVRVTDLEDDRKPRRPRRRR